MIDLIALRKRCHCLILLLIIILLSSGCTPSLELTTLTSSERKIYDDFSVNYNDEALQGVPPDTTFKLYLHSIITGDSQTEYNLYVNDGTNNDQLNKTLNNEIKRHLNKIKKADTIFIERMKEDDELMDSQATIEIGKERFIKIKLTRNFNDVWKIKP